MTRILVIGNSGFFETHLMLRLKEKGYFATKSDVYIKGYDITLLSNVIGETPMEVSISSITDLSNIIEIVPYGKTNEGCCSIEIPVMFGIGSVPCPYSPISSCRESVKNQLNNEYSNDIIQLSYVDNVVDSIVDYIYKSDFSKGMAVSIDFDVSLSNISKIFLSFADGFIPDLSNPIVRMLFAEYNGCNNIITENDTFIDDRGLIISLLNSRTSGQVFISRSKPGIIRGGSHYHHMKYVRCTVLYGTVEYTIKNINDEKVKVFVRDANSNTSINMPPMCFHSMKNIGDHDAIVAIWCNDYYKKEDNDVYY